MGKGGRKMAIRTRCSCGSAILECEDRCRECGLHKTTAEKMGILESVLKKLTQPLTQPSQGIKKK